MWLQFLISSAVIVFAGSRLTTYADFLSDRLNLGKVWIGVILLGLVTSLPEAAASLTSVIALKANDLAVGNIMGSNNFNPVLIVLVDAFYRQGAVTNLIHLNRSHLISAGFAVILTGIVMAEIFLNTGIMLPVGTPLSLGSIGIAVIFFIGMRWLYNVDKGRPLTVVHPVPEGSVPPLSTIYLNLLLSGILVVGGAMWLANVCDTLAQVTGLGESFVGTLFLALATSLPEMVVTVSALRLGSLDLAIGNIFGSNMTNVFILFLCDLFSPAGPLLATVNTVHIVTGVLSIILTGIVLVGFKSGAKKAVFNLGWDSWLLIGFFVSGMSLIYSLR